MTRKASKRSSKVPRKAAGRKARRRWNAPVEWTKEMLALLGKVPDRVISERYGIDISTICKKRKRNGIPAFSRRPIPRPARMVKALALPTREAARRLGVSEHAIKTLRRKLNLPMPSRTEWRWDRKTLARLGREPDTWIAWDTGMGFRTVRAKREALGIPPCGFRRPWKPEEEALLGTVPDSVVAKRTGRTLSAVRGHRWQRGIPAWSPSTLKD